MCAVLNLNPANLDKADVMYSRLSPCFSERRKGSYTGAGQLVNFLVIMRLAQLQSWKQESTLTLLLAEDKES